MTDRMHDRLIQYFNSGMLLVLVIHTILRW
jgi:hypothetical protein